MISIEAFKENLDKFNYTGSELAIMAGEKKPSAITFNRLLEKTICIGDIDKTQKLLALNICEIFS